MEYVGRISRSGQPWSLASTRILFRDLTKINGGRSRSGVDGGESYGRLLAYMRGLVRRSLMNAVWTFPNTRR